MRYLIKYSKESHIKFISHLDLMRTIQRIIRRADLPMEFSKGFNPHMAISIAQPLSVGMYSKGEYMDVVLTKEVSEFYIKDKLNENTPSGIKILEVKKVENKVDEKKIPQAMAMIDAAKYLIKIKYNDTSNLKEELKNLLELSEWSILKKSKSGEKIVDIKPMIKELNYTITDNSLNINAVVSCGSRENLSADLLATFIKNNTKEANMDSFVDVEREEMYVQDNDKIVPLYQYV